MSDPHDWNTWEKYLGTHEKRMQEHPFVVEDRLEWILRGDPEDPEFVSLTGTVVCHQDVHVRVDKLLATRRTRGGRLQVRGLAYAYNVYFVGRHNVLRYDNGHADAPHEFHRHEFDLETGVEVSRQILERREMPVLADFLTEVAELTGFTGT